MAPPSYCDHDRNKMVEPCQEKMSMIIITQMKSGLILLVQDDFGPHPYEIVKLHLINLSMV